MEIPRTVNRFNFGAALAGAHCLLLDQITAATRWSRPDVYRHGGALLFFKQDRGEAFPGAIAGADHFSIQNIGVPEDVELALEEGDVSAEGIPRYPCREMTINLWWDGSPYVREYDMQQPCCTGTDYAILVYPDAPPTMIHAGYMATAEEVVEIDVAALDRVPRQYGAESACHLTDNECQLVWNGLMHALPFVDQVELADKIERHNRHYGPNTP